MPTILFVGGGSVGHIAPAVAIWRAVQERNPQLDAHFVCLDRPDEREFLEAEDLPYSTIAAPRISWRFWWEFPLAYRQACAVLRTINPQVIFSKGGYVSVPLCLAAKRRKIPIVLHESDSVSGRANRFVGRFAAVVCEGFPRKQAKSIACDNYFMKQRESEKARKSAFSSSSARRKQSKSWLKIPFSLSRFTFSSKKKAIQNQKKSEHIYTGNPIRPTITQGNPDTARSITGLTGDKPTLLVMGGSQGAQAINDAIITKLDVLLEHCQIIHITGRGKQAVIDRVGYYATPFVTTELSHFYALADVAMSRAGGGSISELAANGIATILVPLRGVANDHQQENAQCVAAANACRLLSQEDLDQRCAEVVIALLQVQTEREQLGQRLYDFGKADAANIIAKIVCEQLASTDTAA